MNGTSLQSTGPKTLQEQWFQVLIFVMSIYKKKSVIQGDRRYLLKQENLFRIFSDSKHLKCIFINK